MKQNTASYPLVEKISIMRQKDEKDLKDFTDYDKIKSLNLEKINIKDLKDLYTSNASVSVLI
jgi:hypothetical protein